MDREIQEEVQSVSMVILMGNNIVKVVFKIDKKQELTLEKENQVEVVSEEKYSSKSKLQ